MNVAGTRMEVYFAPTDSIADTICNIIGSKITHSIYFCMYKFEQPPIEEALHLIYTGKQLGGVFDSANSILHNSAFPRMKGQAVAGAWNPAADVFIDTIPGLVHHKYFIVDADAPGGNHLTATGSYNWETPAQTGNDENLLVISDARVNNLYYQEFVARYRESGGVNVGSGSGVDGTKPAAGCLLEQNYPNPFTLSTRIKYRVAEPGNVKIIVFDPLGREIITLVDQHLSPGAYETRFDGGSLACGVWFCQLSAGGHVETMKIIHK